MNDNKNSLPIISLVISVLGWVLIMSATPFDISLITMATLIIIIGLICGIISIISIKYKKLCAIIGIIFCLVSFIVKINLDNTRNSSITYNNSKNTTTTTNTSIHSNTNSYTLTTNQIQTTTKNYQQIYNEYSQKLISAGATSSIKEMATILNEGVTMMAQYMYSASGTDGQYATYQNWADKLTEVYMNNCR